MQERSNKIKGQLFKVGFFLLVVGGIVLFSIPLLKIKDQVFEEMRLAIFRLDINSDNTTINNVNTENLNVFAVSENINGKVEVTGKDDLKEGDNLVRVRVTAHNGYSFKDYIVNVHRRTKEEDKIFEEEQNANSEKLNNLIDEKGLKFLSNEQEATNEEENKNNQKNSYRTILIVFGLIVVVGVEIFAILKNKTKKR